MRERKAVDRARHGLPEILVQVAILILGRISILTSTAGANARRALIGVRCWPIGKRGPCALSHEAEEAQEGEGFGGCLT